VQELRQAQGVQQEYLLRAQDEHARLTALLAAMNIGILFVSHDNRVVYSNPAFTRIWMIAAGTRLIGGTPQEALAAAGCQLARPEEQARHLLRPHGEGEGGSALEITLADGRLVTQQMHAVDDVYGRPVGYCGCSRT
jgi:PAS domain-containing protein